MNKLTSLLFAAALALSPASAKAERPYYNNPRQMEFGEADMAVLGVNAGIGCAFGVIPSMVRGNGASRVLEDCLKGVLAGGLIYAGEKAASHASTPALGWAAHILMGNGASMRENLASGNGLFDRLAYDIGPLRLSMGEKHANAGKNVQWYLLPLSLVGIAANIAYQSDWNEKAFLYSGTIVFDYYREGGFLRVGSFFGGTTGGNVITMNHAILVPGSGERLVSKDAAQYALVYEHEQVHAVQYREFGSMDTVLRLSDTYRTVMDTAHLSLGSDAVVMTMIAVPGGIPIAEGVPAALTADTFETVRADNGE